MSWRNCTNEARACRSSTTKRRSGAIETGKACHWYHHAGKIYLQQGRLADLDVVVKEIRSVDPDYEHLVALENALERGKWEKGDGDTVKS